MSTAADPGGLVDLTAVEDRARSITPDGSRTFSITVLAADVLALSAELRRLRARLTLFENVDAFAQATGYTHAAAAEQIRVVTALVEDVTRQGLGS